MQNERLDEAKAGIKITGRNINSLRYTDDTTIMAETEEDIKMAISTRKQVLHHTPLRKCKLNPQRDISAHLIE